MRSSAEVTTVVPLAVLLFVAVALGASEAAAAGVACSTRGAVISGPLTFTASGLSGGGSTLAWADVVWAATARTPATAIGGGIITRSGEIMRGLPIEIASGTLRWSSDRLGARSQPVDGLAAIVLGRTDIEALPALLAGEPGAVLSNGERITGSVSYLNAEAVGLDTGRRVAQVPRARLAAVILHALEPAAAPRTWLQLVTGERLLAGATPPPLPESVIAAWGDGPACLNLIAMPPLRASAVDRTGAALPVRPGAGFPARVGGLACPTGIQLPARGEIAWHAAGAARLAVLVACPASTDVCLAQVVVDGKVAWEQTLAPGAAAVPVTLPVAGAKEIALRAAPSADGETGRRQVWWGMPILLK